MIPINAWIVQNRDEVDSILLSGGKIVVLTEDIPDYLQSPQYGNSCLIANCLLPDYEAVNWYINGDLNKFSGVYHEALMRQESVIYFATMISAIINNIPLGFVFGNEEIERLAANEFFMHFSMVYGIHLGHISPFFNEPANVAGFMERRYSGINSILLYNNNLLTPYEFLYIYPDDMKLDPSILQKLTIDLMPPCQHDFETLEGYFNMFRKEIRKANKVLVDPMVMSS